METKTIRWGIIGAGRIAQAFVKDFSEVTDAEMYAVASRSVERAQAFAQEFSIPKAYGSYEALVEDPDIDVVYIATPHNNHQANTLLCLHHQKAVLCEKPLAVNYSQVKEMLDLAQENQCFLMEAMWMYFLPAIQKAKQWVLDGRIGRPTLIQANFGFKADFDPEGRLFNPALAGGALLDIGIYPIAFATFLADGYPVEIKASGVLGTTGVDELSTVLLSFPNTLRAQLSCSLTNYLNDDGYIYGTEGYIHLPNFWHAEKASLYLGQGDLEETFEDQRVTRGFNFEASVVNAQIRAGKTQSTQMSWNQSLRLIKIMDEVRRQIALKYPFE